MGHSSPVNRSRLPGCSDRPHIRDVETGEVLVELEDLCTFDNSTKSPGADCAQDPNALGDQVWWLDFSPDGSMLAVSGEYSGVEGVWDVESRPEAHLAEWSDR